ncbi:MAG: DUF465 domain-containing protein [Magnetococcales bacterium]|nr:DUF465 domain-containing protein [Magnetococcales bacterium]
MFEDQLAAVHELLETNSAFKELYDQHTVLRDTITNEGHTMESLSLERKKKEKLLIKDRLASMLRTHTEQSRI